MKAQLQQTVSLRFSNSILAFIGKSDFQFSKFQNINIVLEPNIPGSEYPPMIKTNQNKCYIMLYSCCVVLCL